MANTGSKPPTLFSLHMLAYLSLRVLHAVYSMLIAFSGLSIFGQRIPRSLTAKRKQIPTHLAVLLVSDSDLDISTIEEVFIETVENAVQWCRIVGIPKLTVYDSEGM
jgi:dehydrodolichyl diphosphate syntase complex subunit NUS1